MINQLPRLRFDSKRRSISTVIVFTVQLVSFVFFRSMFVAEISFDGLQSAIARLSIRVCILPEPTPHLVDVLSVYRSLVLLLRVLFAAF